ncbi:carboxypeptidase-like regulatory domain-containing protein [Flavobacterium sp. NRK1]|uniref:carboxypeptidase-like regulatory domain-containing protein n=1 Tax=Flavobacterium sp. NRK1 TaxID=2954929 RepID=UPI0020936BD1|nr:carboxypeptidase-like regulatory domain-containing protein [Flavobacterium sp. NRK1]MCO6149039.1 carboxypeptidase-like regulatory domain-containing protein [Flavobacterium sp. NRK1]
MILPIHRTGDCHCIKKIDNACGRFRNNQLNRNLIIPKEKSSLWIAASAAIVSFLTIGNQSISAQTPVNIEQTDIKTDDIIGDTIVMTMSNRIIKGIVKDSTGLVIPGVNVIIKGLKQGIQTDLNGKFSIEANEGQIIEISFIGMLTKEITITSSKTYEVVLLDDIEFYNSENISFDTYGNVIVRKTFFGRIFHSIGNIFR